VIGWFSAFFRFLDRKVNWLFGTGHLPLSCVAFVVNDNLLKIYSMKKIAPILNDAFYFACASGMFLSVSLYYGVIKSGMVQADQGRTLRKTKRSDRTNQGKSESADESR